MKDTKASMFSISKNIGRYGLIENLRKPVKFVGLMHHEFDIANHYTRVDATYRRAFICTTTTSVFDL
jgi:hypothetical protein